MRERRAVGARGRRTRRPPAARALWGCGELAVTLGAVLLLLVVHQLWWTNFQAQHAAQDRVGQLESGWARGAAPGAGATADGPQASGAAPAATAQPGSTARPAADPPPRPGLGYAVLRIPRIGLRAPVAEGVGRAAVLNHGYVGHYSHTAQPGDAGNVALAGHRNTHGEPFRRLDRLRPGDTVRIDTARARYRYVVRSVLPRTSPSDTAVIAAVPHSSVHPSYGFTAPGSYLTLTTCTPEFTSTYRLVVWAELRSASPR
ncbi:class E sortase [Streptomyces pinistramenti]|uniref:class E sortase n=1 Tax=Streptomyces pinistramenti TaxID=2884812 RepID=UPI001D07F449|nr:class E sortase [Streptomyces pinistramenti]MCB5910278.1 class E sortase [Streptomyces pinistramenti]